MAYIRDLERDLIFDYGTNGYKSATLDISKISDGENLYSIKDNYAYHEGELATVATTGSYNDLTNKPTIPAAQVSSDWNASSGVAQILNKPTIPTSVSQLSDADNYLTVNNTTQVGTVTLSTVATSGDYADLINTPTIPPSIVVDQTYDSTSTNAQSGVAVAEALESISVDIDNDTITRNNSEELQSVGIINPRTNTSLKIWEGTEQQWNQGEATTWYYWQTSATTMWTASTLPSSERWYSVAYGDGKFVAVAYSSNVSAYSTDGINWTASTLPSSEKWWSVTYGGGKFVAVASSSNQAAYSTDGINWTESTLPSYTKWYSVAYGDGKFVVVSGSSNKSAYSTDGINWTESTLPSSAPWRAIAYGDGKFVVVSSSSDGKSAYSTDGINWTSSTMPDSAYWYSVAYGNGKFVVTDYESENSAYSTDGINWTASTLPISECWYSVTYGDGKFVAVAYDSNKSAYSTDGINWTVSTMPDSVNWHSVTYGDGKFVAITDDSDVSAIFTMSYDKCYTLDQIPTTSTQVYSAPETISTKTITSVGSGTITLSDTLTYNYTSSGNQNTYRTIGDAHPDWLSNIDNVGVKIGNTLIANNTTSAEWGNITGTLSDQTDLQNALDEKVDSSSLATVATTGEYSDLLNKPIIPTVDQTYNVSSANAQSGVAIEGMMTTKFQVVDALPQNPVSGVFYFIKE